MRRRVQLFHPTLLGLSLLLVFTTGCVNKLRMTRAHPSLGEQLLVSTSIDRSLSELDAEAIGRLKGFKVFISSEYLKTLDQEYLIGSQGPVFVQWRSCGGCSRGGPDDCRGTQRSQLAGQQHRHARHRRGSGAAQPGDRRPCGTAGDFLFQAGEQFCRVKVALVAYQAKSREHIFSSGTLLGGAYDRHFQFLGMIRLRFTDVPELRAIKQLKRRYR